MTVEIPPQLLAWASDRSAQPFDWRLIGPASLLFWRR